MRQSSLPPGIEKQALEAILALASCNGLEPSHVRTIQHCIATCPEEFYRAYEAHFDALKTTKDSEQLNSHLDQQHTPRPYSGEGCCPHS